MPGLSIKNQSDNFSENPPKLLHAESSNFQNSKTANPDNKVVHQRERILVLSSAVLDDQPNEFKTLKRHEEITFELVDKLPTDIKNFFLYVFPVVVEKAKKQWIVTKTEVIDTQGRRCNLCNQPIQKICTIKNIVNDNALEIGKDCAKHYDFRGESNATVDEFFRDQEELQHLRALERKFPGIMKTLRTWKSQFDMYPIVIPSWLERPFNKNNDELNALVDSFLKGKASKKRAFSRIEEIMREQTNLLTNIESFIADNNDKKYMPRIEVGRWLRINGQQDTLEMLKLEGEITWKTAHRIKEPKFMALVAHELDAAFRNIGAKITLETANNQGYLIEWDAFRDIYMFCDHSDLILDYGGLLFGEELDAELNLENIIKIASISRLNAKQRWQSTERIMQLLKVRVVSPNIRIHSFDYDDNEVVIFERETGLYVLEGLMRFVEFAKGRAFRLRQPSIHNIESYISNSDCRRYTFKELKERAEIRAGFNKKEKPKRNERRKGFN